MLRMQRSSAASANGNAKDVIEFTLKPHSSKIRLSATHITATEDETQHSLCKRIADIAHLPLNRLRVTFEKSNRVIDKRFHADTVPKVADIANEDNVLIIKDLGPFLSLRRSLHRLLFFRVLNCSWTDFQVPRSHGRWCMWLNTLAQYSSIPCFITSNISSIVAPSTIPPCKRTSQPLPFH